MSQVSSFLVPFDLRFISWNGFPFSSHYIWTLSIGRIGNLHAMYFWAVFSCLLGGVYSSGGLVLWCWMQVCKWCGLSIASVYERYIFRWSGLLICSLSQLLIIVIRIFLGSRGNGHIKKLISHKVNSCSSEP